MDPKKVIERTTVTEIIVPKAPKEKPMPKEKPASDRTKAKSSPKPAKTKTVTK